MTYHKKMSLFKSGVRLFGYVLLLVFVPLAVFVLFCSEIVGILEEGQEE